MPEMAKAAFGGLDGGAPTAAGSGSSVAPRVRSDFVETWIWTTISVPRADGTVTYEAKVPDTITSWITSAFAVHDETGLGVAPSTAKLQVFQPFFIRLNLPYSVKRGEKLALQVLVFNYMETEQMIDVVLKEDEDAFEFVEKSGEVVKKLSKEKFINRRRVSVAGGGGSRAVFFPIVPKKIGDTMLEVSGTGAQAGDIVRMPLKVEPEGYRVDRNVPVVIELNGQGEQTFEKEITMEFPVGAVQGSQGARFDVIGDIMGPVLSNIEGLVQMPYGCGEQNMLGFVPNIVVMKYLNATQRVEPRLKAKAVKYMEAGYQRELNYKRDDHSYSAFGQSDSHGSTWLTAFVVRSFKQASEYIFVDDEKLQQSIGYILEQQKENGAFAEIGEVHHKAMQGGASEGGVPMTAYVLVALLEAGKRNAAAINYLEQSLDDIADQPYALAVTAYALHLADSPRKDDALAKLEAKMITTHGTVHWEDQVGDEKKPEEKNRYFYQPQPVNVEMTAYALLTYMHKGDKDKGLPIVRWLANQRNAYGGFSSTQDTVMALQALAAYAAVAYSPTFDVTVQLHNGGAIIKNFDVGPQNSIVLQSADLSDLNSPVKITAKGNGVVFGQVQYHYHMTNISADVPFQCRRDVFEQKAPGSDPKKPAQSIVLSVCCKYTRGGKSNMALMEAEALSGYAFDADEINSLTQLPGLQRVELEKADTKTNIYLNPLGEDELCLNMSTQMVYQVADQKPAIARLVDYYDPTQEVKLDYTSKRTSSMLDACPTCWENMVVSESTDSSSNSTSTKEDLNNNRAAIKERIAKLLQWFTPERLRPLFASVFEPKGSE